MNLSFDIKNTEGDHILVALSYYDSETVSNLFPDSSDITLIFYDVTLIRKAGEGYVGSKILFAISDILARFLDENHDAVLCFYCDANTDVRRNHTNMLPQEYRSKLFSRMFDMYIKSHELSGYINHEVEIDDYENPDNRQFAHFICRKEHERTVLEIVQILMQK